ncbi:MAG: trigger factor [Lachnospiraceae bacterium]|nr:trigger factor [Lachnospiraceae bacterium]
MKKRLVIGLAVTLVMGVLSGCGKEGVGNNGAENSAGSTQVNEQIQNRVNVSDLKVEDYVTLGEYNNLAVSVVAQETITDEQVDAQALAIYQNYSTKENGGVTDRAVAIGDTVIIDYVGKKDGVAFEGGTAQGADLTIGSGQFIDGFEDGLIGVKPGETVDLNLTFPENYGSTELAGAKVVFTVTVHFILPTEMKDEVVAGFGFEEFQNVKELKQYCRMGLEENAKYTYEQNLMMTVISVLADNSTFGELPKDLLAQYTESIKADLSANAAVYGVDGATFVYYFYNVDYDTFVTENAQNSTKMILAAQALAEKEGLILKEEELNQRLEQLALDNGWESLGQLLGRFDKEELRESLMYEDVVAFLLKTAQVTYR